MSSKVNLNNESDYINKLHVKALLYLNEKKFSKSEKIYLKIIKKNPNDSIALSNLGVIAEKLNKLEKAIFYFEKTIKLRPENYTAYFNIANIYKKQKNYEKAIFNYNKSIELNPNNILAYNNLGTLFSDIRNYKASHEIFNKILKIDKNFYRAYNNLLINSCYWKNNINYLNIAKRYNDSIKLYKENFLSSSKSKEKILKVGFVSADLRSHSVGYFLNNILKSLKKRKLKLYGYYNYNLYDNITKSLQESFHIWNEIYKMNDLDVIKILRKDNLDILFDLSGHTPGNRLAVFKNRCASTQMTWCGWLASSGIREMDYIVGDPYATPLKDKNKFTEKIYQLDNILFCLSKSDLILDLKIEKNSEKNIVFGCFNKTNKINQDVISTWSKILLKVKNSKLFLKNENYNSPFIRNNILKEFKKHGVIGDQILFEKHSSRLKYFNAYNMIDINLDTFPWNGGITSFESTFMGVPTLTMENNNSFYLRIGESINRNQNMINWIAKNEDDYIKKAVEFAETKKYLSNKKKEIRNNALKSPLFDVEGFAKDFYKMLLSTLN